MELKSKRVLRHTCWCSTSTGGRTHGPAQKILPQPRVLWAYARAQEGHIVTLLAYRCPHQAIVAAFSLDERTVCRCQRESGRQCLRVHEHIIEAGGVLLGQVQADELRIRILGGVVWLASAISVSSRLWLGSVVRIQRDRHLIRALLVGVRACGAFQSLLHCTDGLSSYPKSRRSRYLASRFAPASEDVLGFFCRRVSWSPRRSRGTPADRWSGSFGASCAVRRLRWESGSEPRKVLRRQSSTPPTSSGCRLPSVPGLPRWCAKRVRRRDRGRRLRRACGWSGRSTTSPERIAL